MPISNTLLIDSLRKEIPKYAPSVPTDAVINAGALDLKSLTTVPATLQGIREAYAIAISHVNIFLLAVICISVPTACGMKWRNIKKVSAQREEEKKSGFSRANPGEEQHELRMHVA